MRKKKKKQKTAFAKKDTAIKGTNMADMKSRFMKSLKNQRSKAC